MPRFAYNKSQLNERLQKQLKDAELKFVTAGSHSFYALENGGVLDLVQTAIDVDAQVGKLNAHDIFYGPKTIRGEAISSKTGINICQEIKSIFESFNLSFGDTSFVTDQGSNMVAAFNITEEARIPCMAHRCNTTLETAWNR
ncbi:unnamed protein product, partial [Rotaria magnacalcarata]